MSLVTLITCTGARTEALALCRKYINRQTYKGAVQWIIVDDTIDKAPLPTKTNNISEEIYPGPRKWEPGVNTQRFNTEEALKHVKGDYILFIEDDDYYRPNYVETMVYLLNRFDIVGEGNAKYFNLEVPGWKEMRNFTHASLCQTGIRKELLPTFKNSVDSGSLYFDIELWKRAHIAKRTSLVFADLNLTVGIKGMPGRGNIGIGNAEKSRDFLIDRSLSKLGEWIGNPVDTAYYHPFVRKHEKKELPTKVPPKVQNAANRKG